MSNKVNDIIKESLLVHDNVLADSELLLKINNIVDLIVETYKNNGKVLFCGNGGSAADAQHISAELSGKFYIDRRPLFAEALHVNTSYLTAVANDYSYDKVFSRLVEAKGQKGDVLIGISTSGTSKNVFEAIKVGDSLGMHTISFCGAEKNIITHESQISINVPSNNTPRVQEIHILLGHIICELVEDRLFG